jgi:hypothetical protein
MFVLLKVKKYNYEKFIPHIITIIYSINFM